MVRYVHNCLEYYYQYLGILKCVTEWWEIKIFGIALFWMGIFEMNCFEWNGCRLSDMI